MGFKDWAKAAFFTQWDFILDDHSLEFFINGKPRTLEISFDADDFLKDQEEFVAAFKSQLKSLAKGLIVRPVIKVELKGKLREYKDSKIFPLVFEKIGGREIIMNGKTIRSC